MKAAFSNVALLAFCAVWAAFITYVFYLDFVARAETPPFLSSPVAYVVTAGVGGLLYFWALANVPRGQRAAPLLSDGSPGAAEPAPARAKAFYDKGIVGLIGVAALVYLRGTLIQNLGTTWIDRYWPVILPTILAVAGALWLYDTCAARIINGSHSGRSAFSLRSALIAKRMGVLVAALGLLLLLAPYLRDTLQASYRNPTASGFLAAIIAIGVSFLLIAR